MTLNTLSAAIPIVTYALALNKRRIKVLRAVWGLERDVPIAPKLLTKLALADKFYSIRQPSDKQCGG